MLRSQKHSQTDSLLSTVYVDDSRRSLDDRDVGRSTSPSSEYPPSINNEEIFKTNILEISCFLINPNQHNASRKRPFDAIKSETILTSNSYYNYSLISFIKQTVDCLKKWSRIDDHQNSIQYARQIKTLLADHRNILTSKDGSRLLYGTIMLLFRDGVWNSMNKNQINDLKEAMIKIQDGELSEDSIRDIHQSIYRAKIGLIHPKDDKKE